MTFPLDLIIVIIAAELYREVEPLGGGVLQSVGAYGWFFPWIAYVVISFLTAFVLLRLAESAYSSTGPSRGYRLYKTLRLLYRVLGVLAYPAFLYLTAWNDTISVRWGMPSWCIMDDLLLLMPYLVWTCSWHMLSLRMGRILWHRDWPLREHAWFYARQETLPVLVPWLLLRAAADGVDVLAGHEGMEKLGDWGEMAVSGFFFMMLLYFFPSWLALTLGTKPLEKGPFRDRLGELMQRAGVRFRDILVWRTGGARVLNAAVVGLVPRTRFCILSDTLLESLPPDEAEAVVAHELGHVSGHHLPVYLGFVFIFMGAAVTAFAAVPADLADNYLFSLPVLAGITLLFWPGLFGMVSRRMEDEADLYAAELVGDPEPLIRALSRMAHSSGSGRASGSWRHNSVDKRVGKLRTLWANRSAAGLFHKRVRVLRWATTITAAAAVVVSLRISLPEVWNRDAELERARAAAEGDAENADAWALYGRILLQRERQFEAEEALLQALRGDPGRKDVRQVLRSLTVDNKATLVRMADVLMEAGWYEDAGAIAEELMGTGEADAAGVVSARLALTRGSPALPNRYYNPEGAEETVRALLKGGGSAEDMILLFRALAEQGRCNEAESVLVQGSEKYPENDRFRELLLEYYPSDVEGGAD
ncbi:MAG: M48 family metalloprotease [Planctomycetes bacterium]|nr:M48 family metalloprotease [Planctomycetota bacterium]